MATSGFINTSAEANYSITPNATTGAGFSDQFKPNSDTYFYVAFALSWLNAFLIISLNTAVIVTIVRYKKRSRLYFLLMNLAIADLLTGIVDAVRDSIERSVGFSNLQMVWVFGEVMCKLQRTASNMPIMFDPTQPDLDVYLLNLLTGIVDAVRHSIERAVGFSHLQMVWVFGEVMYLLTGIVDAVPHSIERSVGFSHLQMVWVFGEVMCKIQRTAANMPMTASNYILAATSLDRAMVIYKPMMSVRRGHVLQRVIIAGCWLFSFIVSAPYLHLMTTKQLGFANGLVYCTLDWGKENDPLRMWKMMVVVMFVYIFAIPFIVIVVSYAILLTSIYKRTMMATQTSLQSQKDTSASHVFNRSLPKSKIKSIKLTCGIILGFFLSWMVFFVVIFMNVYNNFNHQFVMIAMTFYFWNSVANPVLFFIYHRRQQRRVAKGTCSSDVTRNTLSSELRSTTRYNNVDASPLSVSHARCLTD